MIIRKIDITDSEDYLNMLYKLDNETRFMMYEPEERSTEIKDIEELIESMNKTNSLLLVAEENSSIVGFLSAERGIYNRVKHSAYIVTGILAGFRGRKIGTGLFKELDVWAVENNIARLELSVMTHNEAALRLYKKIGFKIEGIKEKSLKVDGEFVDEYYMAKLL